MTPRMDGSSTYGQCDCHTSLSSDPRGQTSPQRMILTRHNKKVVETFKITTPPRFWADLPLLSVFVLIFRFNKGRF